MTRLAALPLLLAACAGQPTPQLPTLSPTAQAALQRGAHIGCVVDGIVQPIAADLLDALVPASVPFVAIDNGLVHPAISRWCQDHGGVPAVVPVAQCGCGVALNGERQ